MVTKHTNVLQQSMKVYRITAKTHCYKISIKHKCILQKYRTTDKRNAQRKYIAYKTNNSNNTV